MSNSNTVSVPLFDNNYKEKDTQPDYRFSQKVGDGDYLNVVAGWDKESASGVKYISLSINLDDLKRYIELDKEEGKPEKKEAPKKKEPSKKKANSVIDPDDLPF